MSPQLASIARVVNHGPAGEIPSAAYLAWVRMRTIAEEQGGVAEHDGEVGLEFVGTLTAVLRDLFPEWQWVGDGWAESEERRKAINAWLKRSGNAVCTRRPGRGGDAAWWVRDEWSAASVRVAVVPTPTERSVTATEAGETREPAPVAVSYKCGTCGQSFPRRGSLALHEIKHAPKVSCPGCGRTSTAGGLTRHRCPSKASKQTPPQPVTHDVTVTALLAERAALRERLEREVAELRAALGES